MTNSQGYVTMLVLMILQLDWPADFSHNITKWFLPTVHLDHSHPCYYLIHQSNTLVCILCCFLPSKKEWYLLNYY